MVTLVRDGRFRSREELLFFFPLIPRPCIRRRYQIVHVPQSHGVAPNCPSQHSPMLPVEMVDMILQNLARSELYQVSQVCRTFHAISKRILYRTISDLTPPRYLRCLKALNNFPDNAKLVRGFFLELDSVFVRGPKFGHLLRDALHLMSSLTSLTLTMDFARIDDLGDCILKGCSFSLKTFQTSAAWTTSLVAFLETQPTITELCVHGIDSHIALPPLPPTCLPNLTRFRAANDVSPEFFAGVIRGRPVDVVSIPLRRAYICKTLDALLLSTAPLKRLTILSFDIGPPSCLFPAVSQRTPGLEAMHIVTVSTCNLVRTVPSFVISLNPHLPHTFPPWYVHLAVTVTGRRQPAVPIQVPALAHHHDAVHRLRVW
jgi:hypothetical protein